MFDTETQERALVPTPRVPSELLAKWIEADIQYHLSQFHANQESVKRSGMAIDMPDQQLGIPVPAQEML